MPIWLAQICHNLQFEIKYIEHNYFHHEQTEFHFSLLSCNEITEVRKSKAKTPPTSNKEHILSTNTSGCKFQTFHQSNNFNDPKSFQAKTMSCMNVNICIYIIGKKHNSNLFSIHSMIVLFLIKFHDQWSSLSVSFDPRVHCGPFRWQWDHEK